MPLGYGVATLNFTLPAHDGTIGRKILEMLYYSDSVSSVHAVVSDSLWLHGLQHTRPPCPSPTPTVYLNSCPLSWWCHANHLILCCPLLLPPSIFPSIRVFSNESVLHIRWPKYWSFSLFWLIHLYKNLGVPLHYNMHVILKHWFSSIKGLIGIWKAIFPSSQHLSHVPYLLMP